MMQPRASIIITYVAKLTLSVRATDSPPILSSVRGVLKKADVDEYRKHLAAKYR
jgi:hypothetical protein